MSKEIVYPKKLFDPGKGISGVSEERKGMPWSQAVKANGFLFIAGQASVDMDGKVVYVGDIVKQTEQTFENLKRVLEEAECTLEDVVQTNWYTTSVKDFFEKGASDVRRRYFKKDFPTSTLVEIRRLTMSEMLVELQAIATLPK
ncbi:MAG: RidA family protein [Candidatus Bathyarchaeia archaeon]|jgi:reactive intermediate/imine deaminase